MGVFDADLEGWGRRGECVRDGACDCDCSFEFVYWIAVSEKMFFEGDKTSSFTRDP